VKETERDDFCTPAQAYVNSRRSVATLVASDKLQDQATKQGKLFSGSPRLLLGLAPSPFHGTPALDSGEFELGLEA
jgi:hypothetical protein